MPNVHVESLEKTLGSEKEMDHSSGRLPGLSGVFKDRTDKKGKRKVFISNHRKLCHVVTLHTPKKLMVWKEKWEL